MSSQPATTPHTADRPERDPGKARSCAAASWRHDITGLLAFDGSAARATVAHDIAPAHLHARRALLSSIRMDDGRTVCGATPPGHRCPTTAHGRPGHRTAPERAASGSEQPYRLVSQSGLGPACSRDACRLIRSLGLAVILPSLATNRNNWCKPQRVVLGYRLSAQCRQTVKRDSARHTSTADRRAPWSARP